MARPPTWLHILLCLVMVGIYVGCYVTEIPLIIDFFGVDNDITAEMGKALAAICAVLAVLYAAVSIPTRDLHSKIDTALNRKLKKKVAV